MRFGVDDDYAVLDVLFEVQGRHGGFMNPRSLLTLCKPSQIKP